MSSIIEGLRRLVPQLDVFEHNPRRLYIRIPRESVTAAARYLHCDCGMRLSICTGVDTRDGFEILYHFSDDHTGIIHTLKVILPKDDPTVESQATWFPAADWIEREMHELLGIDFVGHPGLKPLLTSDTDWDASQRPLRRDYERRGEFHER